MSEPDLEAGVAGERRARLGRLPKTTEPAEWAHFLACLVDRAETIGATDLARRLQLEIWATVDAYTQRAGTPGQSLRFRTVPSPIREPEGADVANEEEPRQS